MRRVSPVCLSLLSLLFPFFLVSFFPCFLIHPCPLILLLSICCQPFSSSLYSLLLACCRHWYFAPLPPYPLLCHLSACSRKSPTTIPLCCSHTRPTSRQHRDKSRYESLKQELKEAVTRPDDEVSDGLLPCKCLNTYIRNSFLALATLAAVARPLVYGPDRQHQQPQLDHGRSRPRCHGPSLPCTRRLLPRCSAVPLSSDPSLDTPLPSNIRAGMWPRPARRRCLPILSSA